MLHLERMTPKEPTAPDLDSDCIEVLVPSFPSGPLPPAGEALPVDQPTYEPVDPLPIYLSLAMLRRLAADEARFRQRTPCWHERMWFLTGAVLRDPSGRLYILVEDFIEPSDITGDAASFSLGPSTWPHLFAQLKPGRLAVGWIHSHDLAHLQAESAAAESTAGREAPATQAIGSLFVSAVDVRTVTRAFGAAYHVTAVLASDAIGDENRALIIEAADMGKILGVWSFAEGLLLRRSATLIP